MATFKDADALALLDLHMLTVIYLFYCYVGTKLRN